MSQSPFDFLNLFVEPPGDLLYFLVVIAISQAGLFMALGHRIRFPYERSTQRYIVATFGLVGVWVLLLAGALFALLSSQNPIAILPPLERLAYAITLLLLTWAFLTADHIQWGNRSNSMLLVSIGAIVLVYIYTALQWGSTSSILQAFNLSSIAIVWSFIPTFLALVGLLLTLVYFRLVVDAPIKLVFFLLIVVGNGANLIQFVQGPVVGNYLGSARLAYVTALSIMPVIIYRMVVSYLENSVAEVAMAASQPTSPIVQKEFQNTETVSAKPALKERISAPSVSSVETQSVQILKAMGLMLEATDSRKIPEQVIMATIDILRADIGALIKVQDANYADIVVGYDRVMKRPLAGISLSLDDQPTLVNAIERRTQRALFRERNVEEMDDLYRRLDIDQRGEVYIQPLVRKQELVAVLLIGLPYSRRELSNFEGELLRGIGIVASNLLALSFEAQEASLMAEERAIQAMVEGVSLDEIDADDVLAARQEMEASLQLARDQITQLSRQVMQLKVQLDEERSRVVKLLGDEDEDLSVTQRIRVLMDEQNELRSERDVLAQQLQYAETTLTTVTAQDEESLAHDISESLRREYDALVSARDRLRKQIDDLRARDKTVINQDVHSMLKTMSEEKSILEVERNQLNDKLTSIQSQLNTMGIEGGMAGVTKVVAHLYTERKKLMKRLDVLQGERDALLHERGKYVGDIEQVKQRDEMITNLQKQIKHLAADRETFVKLRERMRSDYKDLLAKFDSVKDQRGRLLQQVKKFEGELQEAHHQQSGLHEQIQRLADERSNLSKLREQLTAQIESLQAQVTPSQADETQTAIREQLESLQAMIKDLTEDREKLELELNYTQTALAESRNHVDRLEISSNGLPIQDPPSPSYTLQNPELFVSLVQELRTPMTSIAGYVDLLLGESAGILGEMQRNFLQRVSANILRLTSMINDLVKVTQLDTGQFELERRSIDVVSILEDAITDASNQFREKDLRLNLALDDTIPSIPVDKDAMRQIINQLLTNAYLVSSAGSELTIVAQIKQLTLPGSTNTKDPVDTVYVTVEDRGGGIMPEDIPRVFARKYKAENPLIEGLGDTGVGMSIAKALIEAHQGYLWVESQPGIGSRFSFALPLYLTAEIEE